MKKMMRKKWFLGLFAALICMLALPVCANAAYELDGRQFASKDGCSIQFHKVGGNDYLVIYAEQGMDDVVCLRWTPSKTSKQYKGTLVSATTGQYAGSLWLNITNSSLLVKDDKGTKAYFELVIDLRSYGSDRFTGKGIMNDVTPFRIIGAKTLWTSGGTKSVTLKALYGVDQKARTASWSTSNKKIATVSKTGKVTAKKAGTVKITAKINGRTSTVKITVKKPTIKLSKKSAKVKAGQTYKLKATVKGPSSSVTWSTSNKKVATVDKNGLVTAKKKGTAKITAKANGIKATFKLTVKK